MKSVGEVMAIGRTFKESLFKALRSLEAVKPFRPENMTREQIVRALSEPNENRLHMIVHALDLGWSVDELASITHVDPWFLDQVSQFAELQTELRGKPVSTIDEPSLRLAKEFGFSDRRLSYLTGNTEKEVRERRPAPANLNHTRPTSIQRMKKKMRVMCRT